MNGKINQKPKSGFFINRIIAEEIYGQFSYDLKFKSGVEPILNNLLILYGDNGSGKTTILTLIYHLLSPELTRGHKTYVARIPFRSFSIFFLNGTVVKAVRTPKNIVGSYTIELTLPQGKKKKIHLEADEEKAIKIPEGEKKKEEFLSFFNEFQNLDIGIHFLSDTRKVWSDIYEEEEDDDDEYIVGYREYRVRKGLSKYLKGKKEQSVEKAIRQLEEWIRNQVIQGSNIGAESTNTIYIDIIRQIATSPIIKENIDQNLKSKELLSTINEVSERSKEYFEFGLTSRTDLKELTDFVSQAPSNTLPIINNILNPFVDGINARLNALEDIKMSISMFVKFINGFYHNKTVKFNLRTGLTIHDQASYALNPNMLSSGEKQLLLLLCNTMIAKDRASLIIIDEPEISLNVKWQRKLIQVLLDCIQRDNVQIVLATHSLELISRHKYNIMELKS